MKAHILSINGKKLKQIELPKIFSGKVRADVVEKVLEAQKRKQPYAPSLVAGKQQSAKGIIRHKRHEWKVQYGRGMSRIPRKIMMRRGSQFRWEGAYSPNTRGGMRAHPPKIIAMMKFLKINKKEFALAFSSALSATTTSKLLLKKYSSLEKLNKEFPLVVESKLTTLKAKEFLKSLKEILGEELMNISVKKKSQRAGKGKMRGRKYKSNAGLLLVQGMKENLKTNAVEVVRVNELGVTDLARGGLGRLTIYTEDAIKYLREKK